MSILLSNRELEKLDKDEKVKYFTELKNICQNIQTTQRREWSYRIIMKAYPFLRGYDYEIRGVDNIPSNGGLFVFNHSNSHDVFTINEVFKKIGLDISILGAKEEIGAITRFIFSSCDMVLFDRTDKASIEGGVLQFSGNLSQGKNGGILGEATWNLHPVKPMLPVKLGAINMAAISEKPIIPVIIEYVETPRLCSNERDLYTHCIIKFGPSIKVHRDRSLVPQVSFLQKAMESMRRSLWEEQVIKRENIEDVDQLRYLNHTYLKKFGAVGFTYDSSYEQQFILKEGDHAENEYKIDENGNFVPGVTSKEEGKKYVIRRKKL